MVKYCHICRASTWFLIYQCIDQVVLSHENNFFSCNLVIPHYPTTNNDVRTTCKLFLVDIYLDIIK